MNREQSGGDGGMNLLDLKHAVDFTIDHLHHQNPKEINVVITLSESSMGARASSAVKYAGQGMDWEHGQFRLEPIKNLVTKGNNLTDVKSVVCRQYDGRNFYFCPRCNEKIAKKDNYCRGCSQKLK